MVSGRPPEPRTLTREGRATLPRWTGGPTTAQALMLRARLVLAVTEGRSNDAVAAALTIAARTIGDAGVERVTALTLESAPGDATHWSTRSMAARSGQSQSSISQI